MNPFELAMATAFWLCGALVVYAYVIYPALICWLARRFAGPCRVLLTEPEELPEVTLLIAAYNEEDVIESRLRNALAMDYPRERLEIVIGLDGCTDATARIARGFACCGVRVLDFPQRRGKASVLNAAIPQFRFRSC